MSPKAVSHQFLETMEKNRWPGNVRELINVLEHALASAGNDPTLVPKHLPPEYRLSGIAFDPAPENSITKIVAPALGNDEDLPTLTACRSDLEKTYLKRLRERAGSDRKIACRLSGLSQARLYALLKKYHLPGFGIKNN